MAFTHIPAPSLSRTPKYRELFERRISPRPPGSLSVRRPRCAQGEVDLAKGPPPVRIESRGVRTGPSGWQEIYAVVKRIPRGRVATYGQVALLLGRPRAARQVGYAMAALRGARHDVPWQRVLGARPRACAAV